MDNATRLWELLGMVKARPEGLGYTELGGWTSYGFPIDDDHALAILRDAARQVCDNNMVEITWDSILAGEITHWCVEYRPTNGYKLIAENCESYESALIAGLEWIIAQEADRG